MNKTHTSSTMVTVTRFHLLVVAFAILAPVMLLLGNAQHADSSVAAAGFAPVVAKVKQKAPAAPTTAPVTPVPTQAPANHRPMFDKDWPITTGYGHYEAGGAFTGAHYGLDVAAALETALHAPVAGTIMGITTGCSYGSVNDYCGASVDLPVDSGLGNHLVLKSDETGHLILFGHLSRLADGMVKGVHVDAGAVLGWTGSSGHSSGPHVHIQEYTEINSPNATSSDSAWEWPWLLAGNADGKVGELYGTYHDRTAIVVPAQPTLGPATNDYYNPRAGNLEGTASFYAPGVMEMVARNRGMQMRSDVDGYASTMDVTLLGSVVVASIMGGAPERFQVLDVSADVDKATQASRRQVIEVDWETAVRHGLDKLGRGPATLLYVEN